MIRSPSVLVAAFVLLAPATLRAQTVRDIRVSEPTRLDWQFAAFGFKTRKLPDDFDSRNHRYQLFVPAGYKASKSWPVVVFISAGDGPVGWNEWQKACGKHGVFFCSPY